ncbi:uncharacterized protein BDW47DRAFT_110415 [Aspergillus candidus]|uniref:Uncharacterized protein n=1 Tax=Aspergillus candidus TaxID=41067 RepID=A0A2I2F4C0_ASPCN|nr:hypothetical protein BDW47DRAFT_110415 [Aspergillus candidus]PLB35487.1 hypothetical protein BDW47DRAFT_110415 [Aspergillus candidus]
MNERVKQCSCIRRRGYFCINSHQWPSRARAGIFLPSIVALCPVDFDPAGPSKRYLAQLRISCIWQSPVIRSKGIRVEIAPGPVQRSNTGSVPSSAI